MEAGETVTHSNVPVCQMRIPKLSYTAVAHLRLAKKAINYLLKEQLPNQPLSLAARIECIPSFHERK